jgi:hypothetical protein
MTGDLEGILAQKRYRINSPHVVAETLDGEATIVDLENGTYHALNESGSFIWDELTRGAEPSAVTETLASTYGLDDGDASRIVEDLTAKLAGQNLIVPARADSGNGSAAPVPAASNGGPETARPYVPPELSTYTDMQELLLLDPIHEVDESGWPSHA